jgi:hypothetical protein
MRSQVRLSSAAADVYLATSSCALALGVISWNQYALRLKFLRDNVEANSNQGKILADFFGTQEATLEDDWPYGESQDLVDEVDESDSRLTGTDEEDDFLYFCPRDKTGLTDWEFHLGDADYFPSIPHGHSKSKKPCKLDAYRGWIYKSEKQIGREDRCKIIALWNDERFRAMAACAIDYYLSTFPNFHWRVGDPRRLPRRR